MVGGVKKELGQLNGRDDMCKIWVIWVFNISIFLQLEKLNYLFGKFICNIFVLIYNLIC